MKRAILIAVNILCLLGMLVAIAWASFAIGKPQFMDRYFVVVLFQIPCLTMFIARRWHSRWTDNKMREVHGRWHSEALSVLKTKLSYRTRKT